MKRILVVALGLLFAPALASAQVEIGLDAGLTIESIDDFDDNVSSIRIPTSGARIAFPAGETLIVETLLGFDWVKVGDFSSTGLDILPGVNFLLNDQFYVRGEAGLSYDRESEAGESDSDTQYILGAGAGLRKPVSDNVLFRVEGAIDRWMEKTDNDVVTIRGSWEFRLVVGVSAVVN